jgi:hypothetical protein
MSNGTLDMAVKMRLCILRRLQDELLGGYAAVVFAEISEKSGDVTERRG